jgi:SOS response regulatory protein OraA/RecX
VVKRIKKIPTAVGAGFEKHPLTRKLDTEFAKKMKGREDEMKHLTQSGIHKKDVERAYKEDELKELRKAVGWEQKAVRAGGLPKPFPHETQAGKQLIRRFMFPKD